MHDLRYLTRSEKLDSTRFDIHFDLALVLLQQNQSGEAAEELERAVKLQPSRALAHVLLGRAYQNTNRTLLAVEQFQTALHADPNTPLGHYHLGFAYASLGRTQEARQVLEAGCQRCAQVGEGMGRDLGPAMAELLASV